MPNNARRTKLAKIADEETSEVDFVVKSVQISLLGKQYDFLVEKASEMSVSTGKRLYIDTVVRALIQKEMDIQFSKAVLND